ncbi:malate dehydrogenase [Mycena sanguinolenta]|uniref:malate dehydrogenase n=1 Tax=Mycena sanguinolenta TaxID=230812 RepID=A0A8H6ZD61_9AGAR|nr:malate dehydrogenase [Mycena sanguinolenta]
MSSASFPTRQLGANGPTVSALGFGTMGIGAYYGQTDQAQAFATLSRAAELGITFWDCADIYGSSEEVLGDWFTQTGRRAEIFLATKFGAIDLRPDAPKNVFAPCSDPAYIAQAFERSLARLKTDYVDLYYQHRVDPRVPIEVVLESLRPYVEQGKIKWLGLSECSPATLRRAKAVKGIGEKVVAVQMEYSLFDMEIETNGLLEAARETGVAVVAYSPLGRGLLTGSDECVRRFRSREDFEEGDFRRMLPRFSEENFPKNIALVDHLQQIADKHNATSGQVTLAWMLAEHSDFFPIPGTRNVARLEENAHGAEIALSAEDVKDIRSWAAAANVQGDRKRAEHFSDGECISLEEWKVKVKAVVLGAAGGIGQPLSLLLKTNPAITELGLFDIVNTPGVAVDLSHIDTPAVVVGRLPPDDGLKAVLTGADIVVIPAGVPRKPGMTRDDLFKINGGIVKDLATGIATFCPKAFVLVISNPVNSTVPIVAEVFKHHKVYDPKRIFGVTTLDVVRASTFVAEIIGKTDVVREVTIPVVGGHSGVTIIPLLSQSSHPLPADLAKDKFDALVNRIQFGGDEVVKAKGRRGVRNALDGGEKGIVAPSFVALEADPTGGAALAKELATEIAFFSSNVELGREGVAKIHPLGKITPGETELVKAAIPELRKNIETGVTFCREKYEAEEKNPKL